MASDDTNKELAAALSGGVAVCVATLGPTLTPAVAGPVCGALAVAANKILKLIKSIQTIKGAAQTGGKVLGASSATFGRLLLKEKPNGKGLIIRALKDLSVGKNKATRGARVAALMAHCAQKAGLHPYIMHSVRYTWYKELGNKGRAKQEAASMLAEEPSWKALLSSMEAASELIKPGPDFAAQFDQGYSLAVQRVQTGGEDLRQLLNAWLAVPAEEPVSTWQNVPEFKHKVPSTVIQWLKGDDPLASGQIHLGDTSLGSALVHLFAKCKPGTSIPAGDGKCKESTSALLARHMGSAAAMGWLPALVRDVNNSKGYVYTVPANEEAGDDGESLDEETQRLAEELQAKLDADRGNVFAIAAGAVALGAL